MPDLFGLDIQGLIADSIADAGGLESGTLNKITHGPRTASNLTAGRAQTPTAITFSGILEDVSEKDRQENTVVEENDKRITIITGSMSPEKIEAEVGWTVVMRSRTWTVIGVGPVDPAEATQTLFVR